MNMSFDPPRTEPKKAAQHFPKFSARQQTTINVATTEFSKSQVLSLTVLKACERDENNSLDLPNNYEDKEEALFFNSKSVAGQSTKIILQDRIADDEEEEDNNKMNNKNDSRQSNELDIPKNLQEWLVKGDW